MGTAVSMSYLQAVRRLPQIRHLLLERRLGQILLQVPLLLVGAASPLATCVERELCLDAYVSSTRAVCYYLSNGIF